MCLFLPHHFVCRSCSSHQSTSPPGQRQRKRRRRKCEGVDSQSDRRRQVRRWEARGEDKHKRPVQETGTGDRDEAPEISQQGSSVGRSSSPQASCLRHSRRSWRAGPLVTSLPAGACCFGPLRAATGGPRCRGPRHRGPAGAAHSSGRPQAGGRRRQAESGSRPIGIVCVQL